MPRAIVRITRHDYFKIRDDHLVSGIKALLDVFKERTSGRQVGNWLYYFGAIVDDGPTFIKLEWDQHCVDHPADACTRIRINAL